MKKKSIIQRNRQDLTKRIKAAHIPDPDFHARFIAEMPPQQQKKTLNQLFYVFGTGQDKEQGQ